MSKKSIESLLQSDIDFTSFDITEDEDLNIVEAWESLINHLTTKHLENLQYFFKDEIDNSNLKLNKDEFVYAIDTVLGNSNYSLQAISLYNEIPFPDEDKITWNQFLDYYIAHGLSEKVENVEFPDPEIISVPHVERETIVKIVSISTETSFCYAIISKYGKVGLYTGDFNLLQQYQITFTRCDKELTTKYNRIRSMWITDAIFIPNVEIFIVCNTARSIIFYDASGQKHIPLYLVEGIPNAIYSLEYHCEEKLKLFLGNEKGSIVLMTFLQQKEGLLKRKYNDRMSHYFWRELKKEKAYVRIETFRKIHSNLILKLFYYPESVSLVSCSRDNKNSIVFFNLKEQRKTYTFKIVQGVSCFSLNNELRILLTGCDDGTIQLWNLYVSSETIATFQGSKLGIVAVQILAVRYSALSCSADGIVKLWSLQNYNCQHTLVLQFPCFGVLGKLIEWGSSTIYSGPKRFENLQNKNTVFEQNDTNTDNNIAEEKQVEIDIWERYPILITCCNYIAKLVIIDEKNDFCSNILPPPLLQNEIIVPEDWKIEEPQTYESEDSSEDEEIHQFENKIHPDVETIIDKSFLEKFPRFKHNMNFKIAALELKMLEMKKPVSQCAPYLALDLHEIQEVKLSLNLPVPQCKKTQHIMERTQRLLSAASTRSGILSDRSSKSRSSRSSIVEF